MEGLPGTRSIAKLREQGGQAEDSHVLLISGILLLLHSSCRWMKAGTIE